MNTSSTTSTTPDNTKKFIVYALILWIMIESATIYFLVERYRSGATVEPYFWAILVSGAITLISPLLGESFRRFVALCWIAVAVLGIILTVSDNTLFGITPPFMLFIGAVTGVFMFGEVK